MGGAAQAAEKHQEKEERQRGGRAQAAVAAQREVVERQRAQAQQHAGVQQRQRQVEQRAEAQAHAQQRRGNDRRVPQHHREHEAQPERVQRAVVGARAGLQAEGQHQQPGQRQLQIAGQQGHGDEARQALRAQGAARQVEMRQPGRQQQQAGAIGRRLPARRQRQAASSVSSTPAKAGAAQRGRGR
jgi:hypothetical protein